MKRALKVDFVRFCLVGATGFAINVILLTLLYKKANLPVFASQLVASEIALFSNFLMHHNWTYKSNNITKDLRILIVQFHVTSWVAIFGSAILVTFFIHALSLNYILALILSSGIALSWNFFWTKYVIWRNQTEV